MPRKLKLLLAVHLALGIAPAAMFLPPPDVWWIPLTWALFGVSYGQLMVLAFWAGMGTSTPVRRLAGTLLGALYLATWPTVAVIVSPYTEDSIIATFATWLALDAAMLVMFGGIFLLIRRRFAQLRRVDDADAPLPGRYQFSILHLLLITSLVAVVLGLVRGGTSDDNAIWHELASNLLAVIAFVVNLVAAPWAALARGPVRLRVALVLVVALLLGMAVSFSYLLKGPSPDWRVWLFSTQSLAFAIPPMIVLVSLLVVRSCGYRLAPNAAATRPMVR